MKNSNLISQLLLSNKGATQQDLSFTTVITDGTDTSIALTLESLSQQDNATKKSKIDLSFDADINAMESAIAASGRLSALLSPETLFFNVDQL